MAAKEQDNVESQQTDLKILCLYFGVGGVHLHPISITIYDQIGSTRSDIPHKLEYHSTKIRAALASHFGPESYSDVFNLK